MIEKLVPLHQEIIDIRRTFHKNPEVSFKEEKTPAFIAEYLNKLGNIEVKENVGGRGVTATIKGKTPGKCVALRADFDALAMPDEKDVEYKSQVEGVMHGCGHDAHAASLLGIAKVLSENTDALKGSVRLVFQFAEEMSPGGAISMIEDGCLDGVDAIFATHVRSTEPVGKILICVGPTMAAADDFKIEIHGKGGHGAYHHQAIDPIVIAANVINGFQQIISRRKAATEPAVITVGMINAGSAFNVIPDVLTMAGTGRSYDPAVQDFMIKEMEAVLKANCEAVGATYTFEYNKGYPSVINPEKEATLVRKATTQIFGEENVLPLKAGMGGEDFSYYLQKVPGCFFYIGAGNVEKGIVHPHHHPKFDIDEDALLYSAQALLGVALEYLES